MSVHLSRAAHPAKPPPGVPGHPVREAMRPFVRRHRGMLRRGLVFTVLLVACRLALPLPLTAVVARSPAVAAEPGLGGGAGWTAPVWVLSTAFVSLALLAGMAEHYMRLAHANFTNRTVNDARESALASLAGTGVVGSSGAGERSAQVMADCARVKQGSKGVLNHITLNALLVAGACVALALTDLTLGIVQLVGAVAVVGVAFLGASRVATVASGHRAHEALLAAAVQRFVADGGRGRTEDELRTLDDLDHGSRVAETAMTCWEGRTTWAAHVVLAVTAAVVLVLGLSGVATGRLDTATLFTVVAYLLVLHGPAVRFARQLTRVGPLRVSAAHLAAVLSSQTTPTETRGDQPERPPTER